MAKRAHRTPPPAVHPHFPATPPTVKRDGPKAGAGAAASLNDPWGARPPGPPSTAPGQPPPPPDRLTQMQGAKPPAVPRNPAGKFQKPPTGRRPRSGDEA